MTIFLILEGPNPLGHQGVREPLVDGQHLLRVPEDPLLVGVGGQVVGGRVVAADVQEHVLVLGGAVFRAVGGGIG